ncbi:MAG: sugar phosphate isomerase/epimerase [Ferruginibacter sp.]
MQNRRNFIKITSTLALGGLVLPGQTNAFYSKFAMPPVGLQLFTLFNVIDDDTKGILKKVADIGYKEIESAFSKKGGYYGMKPKEFAALIKDLGMSWKSHHVLGAPFKLPPGAKMPAGPDGKPITIPPMRNLRENFQALVDEAAEGGVEYLVCASTPIETLDEVKSSIDVLNQSAEAAKKAGIKLAYHNHDREFHPIDGKVPYDMLLSDTDPNLLKMELDLCWVTKAGVDPAALFKKNPGRFELWHVKDLDKAMTGPQPVGTGIVDFKTIFANAGVSGMKYFFVEHDMPADPIASITTSFNNLKKLLG